MSKRTKQQSVEIVVADGEFSAPNLIRSGSDWVGIPITWLHLVPDRIRLERVRVVLQLQYKQHTTGDDDEQAE